MKYDQLTKTFRTALLVLIAGWAVFCIHRYYTGQIVLWDVLVLVLLDRMRLWTTPSGGKPSRAPARDARASSLRDTAYRRLNDSAEPEPAPHPRRRASARELSEAEWEQQRQAQAEPYISRANISATVATLQPTEDGRELGDHGLILSVLAALRSADALPLPARGVLKQLVYEMAYRFAQDSGIEERSRKAIVTERRTEAKIDAYDDHCAAWRKMTDSAAQLAAAALASQAMSAMKIDPVSADPKSPDIADALVLTFLDPPAASASGQALHLFAEERSRQVNAEGFNPEADDRYLAGELARAAAAYALPGPWRHKSAAHGHVAPSTWPWPPEWFKPTPNDRLREVLKAGALLLAEAERLIRETSKHSP